VKGTIVANGRGEKTIVFKFSAKSSIAAPRDIAGFHPRKSSEIV